MIVNADARHLPIADSTVQCVVTSPPYYGLRDYGVSGQIGLEQTPDEYVAVLVAVFREVWRVLKDDGTLWLNLGDSFAGSGQGWSHSKKQGSNKGAIQYGPDNIYGHPPGYISSKQDNGLKPKDLIGIPWMVAFALRADGWYLRSDIIWNKPNPMPESVTDRPTKAHEYLFLLTKSARYYYDAEAIFEPASYDGRKDTQFKGATKSYDGVMPNGKPQSFAQDGHERWPNKIQTKYAEDDSTDMGGAGTNWVGHSAYHGADGRELFQRDTDGIPARNKRTVWTINTQPCKEAHYAVMPEKLVEPCILAGSRAGDIILDPFIGSGTVERVAIKHGRKAIGTELKYQYIADIASKRISNIEVMLPLESTYDPNHRPHRHLHPGRWTGWTREA